MRIQQIFANHEELIDIKYNLHEVKFSDKLKSRTPQPGAYSREIFF